MAPDERDRQEETREEAAAPGGQAPAGDAPEELRYEGPITIDDDEDDDYLDEGGGSGKFFLTAALLSALVLVTIATAMWMRSGAGNREPAQDFAAMQPPPPVTAQAAAADTAPAPGEVDYRALPDAPAATGGNAAPPVLPPVEEPPVQRAEADPAGRQRSTAAAVPPVPRPRPREARDVEASAPTSRSADASPAQVRRLVLAGRVDEAARTGRAWASSRPRDEWTFQVLLACRPGTVERAFRKVIDPGLVLLPARLADGRGCYRVCWGTFPSREAAAASLRDVPAYFRRETKPLPRTWGDVLP